MGTSQPAIIHAHSFQEAWTAASRHIARNGWEARNLLVTIADIDAFDNQLHARYRQFCVQNGLLTPKQVAYTIFPQGMTARWGGEALFEAYNRPGGMFHRLHRMKPGWGTYFRRMTCYEAGGTSFNQVGAIMSCLNARERDLKAAYTMIIQRPGGENIRPRGGPCLNYVALQVQPGSPREIALLAVYRNHDFLERAYGNYLGLTQLLRFICAGTGSRPGPLTCLDSHAYVSDKKRAFQEFLDTIG